MIIVQFKMRKIGRIGPMTIEPVLEVLRERVTGEKNASIRKHIRRKIKMLTGASTAKAPVKSPVHFASI
jgi:hypothetical protein